MTDTAPDLPRRAAAVHEATERLLVALAALDDTAIGDASLLPDWTRGHVLAHLARNADALVNLLISARTGEPRPMYADSATRDSDIERGADRPLAVHLEDLRESARRFDAAVAALPPERWGYQVEMRNGVVERADRLPLRRLAEVELHHVDLGIGYTVDRLAPSTVDALLDFLTTVKYAGRTDLSPLELRADDGRQWHTGAGDGAPVTVSGPATELLGWLTGRSDGRALTPRGTALPVVPPL